MAWREDKVTVNIVEHLGVLGQYGKDSLEANIVSWNDKPAKLDIRKWVISHSLGYFFLMSFFFYNFAI